MISQLFLYYYAMVFYLHFAWKSMVVDTFYAIIGNPYTSCNISLFIELNRNLCSGMA